MTKYGHVCNDIVFSVVTYKRPGILKAPSEPQINVVPVTCW